MNNFDHILKTARDPILTAQEKSAIADKIRMHIAAHPVSVAAPQPSALKSKPRPVVSTYFSFWKIAVPSFVVIALLFTGGVASAAKGALPGDVLYPIKVNVTEKVQLALSIGAAAKAKTEAQLALNRLDETEKLAESGKLDAKTQAELQANFSEHAQSVLAYVGTNSTSTYSEQKKAAADFEKDLSDHEKKFGNLAIGVTVAPQAAKIMTVSAKIEATTTAPSSASSTKSNAKKNIRKTEDRQEKPAESEFGGIINSIRAQLRSDSGDKGEHDSTSTPIATTTVNAKATTTVRVFSTSTKIVATSSVPSSTSTQSRKHDSREINAAETVKAPILDDILHR